MDGLKQRIIGALVIISLAIIFVPMMFEKPHQLNDSQQRAIPEEPAFPEVTIVKPEAPQSADYVVNQQAAESSAASAETPVTSAPEAAAPADTAPLAATPVDKAPVDTSPVASSPIAKAAPQPEPAAASGYKASLDGAWVVQLGSFGTQDNATRLRDQVRAKGFAAFTTPVQMNGQEMTRVFTGPFVDKKDADAAKKALDQAFALNSKVMAGQE